MNKLMFGITLLALLWLFASESDCFKLFESREAPSKDIWYFVGTTREKFKREHGDLTPRVQQNIAGQIIRELEWFEKLFEKKVSLLELETTNAQMEKRSGMENVAEVAKKDLTALKETLNISGGIRNPDDFRQPAYIQDCLAGIHQNDDKDQKKLKFYRCGALIFRKTLENIRKFILESLEIFIQIFEEYIRANVSFLQLYHQYVRDTGEQYMKRGIEMADVKRVLEDLLTNAKLDK
ncbi:uncharacterized protein LOC125656470 [Ostrea edulis]|uniref:uncharacterized protein LOC125656470 n=1 Tax=Ostrea edulis TaxID=37623 RepID=UPI0024AF6F6F|nr:uncharacterized protein LOC125656470 [Ostrea edulis]